MLQRSELLLQVLMLLQGKQGRTHALDAVPGRCHNLCDRVMWNQRHRNVAGEGVTFPKKALWNPGWPTNRELAGSTSPGSEWMRLTKLRYAQANVQNFAQGLRLRMFVAI